MIFLLIVIILSLSISALCSLLEATLLSISNSDIADMHLKNRKFAEIWKIFKKNIQKPIAVILIINTLAHTIGASISGAKFETLFGFEWIILFSILFSYVMIQWTEILPKAIGVKHNRKIAGIMTIPLYLLVKLFTPVVKIIEFLNLPFVGRKKETVSYDTIKDISLLARFALSNNLINKDQEQIISRTVRLSNIKIKDIMVPREDIKVLKKNMSMMDALVEAHIHNHTRFPLLDDKVLNKVLGYINFKDIVGALQMNPHNPSLMGIVRPIQTVYEDETFSNVFKKVTLNHQHIVIVKNKRNVFTGLLTLEDLIEEIIGEIEDEYDVLPSHLFPITPNRYIAGGGLLIKQMNEKLDIKLSDPELTINDWINKHFGLQNRSGNNYQVDNNLIIIKKLSRGRVNEIIIEKNSDISQ
ncbi:MAG: DUF21 domain-containing protein [Spirochaetes bacterium]|nr:DUF21 domain-containing protein [Spirochaetota bacterium]